MPMCAAAAPISISAATGAPISRSTIAPDDMKLFRRAGFDPRTLTGKRVRVRGWVEKRNGPQIEIADPDAIEILGPSVTPSLRPALVDTKRPG